MFRRKFAFTRQLDESDCGPACLKMVFDYFGRRIELDWLKEKFEISKAGVSAGEIESVAGMIGMKAMSFRTTIAYLCKEAPFPAILHLDRNHFVVLFKVSRSRGRLYFHIADPAFGVTKITEAKLKERWCNSLGKGIALFFDLSESYQGVSIQEVKRSTFYISFDFVRKYLRQNMRVLLYISLFVGISTALSWLFPVMIKKLVDKAAGVANVKVFWIIMLSQLGLILGQVLSDWSRGYLSVKLSMKLSNSIILDFINKLVTLPIRFFDLKTNADLIQRIEDHSRVESFLSTAIIQNIFQVITYLIFSLLLFWYSVPVFVIFTLLTGLSILIFLLKLRRIKDINYNQFKLNYEFKNNLYEFISGMVEIRLNAAQDHRIKRLQRVVNDLYEGSTRYRLALQSQLLIVRGINMIKTLSIIGFCTYWIGRGTMTIGTMVSINFLSGYLNSSIESVIEFFRSGQDAKLAIERMHQIMNRLPEDSTKVDKLPILDCGTIQLDNVSFKYPGANNKMILKNVSFSIPCGKVTAIVGDSGSGKTTLLKLLLAYYLPVNGEILLGGKKLVEYSLDDWRRGCGTVMQSGYIFSNSIWENIAIGSDVFDEERLIYACQVACIWEFVASLPEKLNTKIGHSGMSLSGGQTQRILIARSVYKDPAYLFFDEATSSLDSINEKNIMRNLKRFFRNKTVVVIAHRLSTVKSADQIIVLNNGIVAEVGDHASLTSSKGRYYELVKNQLNVE
jgi:ATP-binding cassette subfamily B protein